MKLKDSIIILLICAGISIVGNLVGYKVNIIEAIPGMLILVGIAVAGIVLAKSHSFENPQCSLYCDTVNHIDHSWRTRGSDHLSLCCQSEFFSPGHSHSGLRRNLYREKYRFSKEDRLENRDSRRICYDRDLYWFGDHRRYYFKTAGPNLE